MSQEDDALGVQVEGQIDEDGVVRIDLGVKDTALVTIHFNEAAAGFVRPLLSLASDSFDGTFTDIIEARDKAVAAEEAQRG